MKDTRNINIYINCLLKGVIDLYKKQTHPSAETPFLPCNEFKSHLNRTYRSINSHGLAQCGVGMKQNGWGWGAVPIKNTAIKEKTLHYKLKQFKQRNSVLAWIEHVCGYGVKDLIKNGGKSCKMQNLLMGCVWLNH